MQIAYNTQQDFVQNAESTQHGLTDALLRAIVRARNQQEGGAPMKQKKKKPKKAVDVATILVTALMDLLVGLILLLVDKLT